MSNLVASTEDKFLSMIEKVLDRPEGGTEALDKILDMQERIMNKQAEMQFNSDLAIMLNEIPVIAKTSEAKVVSRGGGPGFSISYASLDEIVEVVRPILSKYGFSVNFEHFQPSPELIRIICVLRHKMGHSVRNELTLPLDVSGAKNSVQSIGSTVTYGKRYTLCSILNIATGDDRDGFTVKANEANMKAKLDDSRLMAAIQSIRDKKYTISKLFSQYEIMPHQKEIIDKELSIGAEIEPKQ